MKRFWLSILMLASIFCLCLAFAACDNSGNAGNSGNESFTPTECTVTYDANGGMFEKDTIFIQSVKMNSVLTAPTSPTRPNYIFSGWAKDKNGLEMWDFSKEKVSGDITLYATWTQQSAAILSVDGARIENNNILMLVSQDTDFVRLAEKVVCSDDSYWQLFYDALGVMEISTKIATSTDGSLKNGNNIFYIVVSSQDKSQTNTYILTIHRQYLVTISYIANNLLYKENVILTGSELTEKGIHFMAGIILKILAI